MNTVTIFAKKDYVSRDGTIPIYIRLTMNRKVHPPIYLEKRVTPAMWDDRRHQVRAAYPNADKINLLLSRALARAQEILLDHELSGRPVSYESFTKEFAGLSPYDFYILAEEYLDVNKGSFSDSYVEKVGHVVDKLREFAPTLELHQVDYMFIKKYHSHLATVRGNKKNTIHSNLRIIRRIFKMAVSRELIKKNPFDTFRLEGGKAQRDALSIDEVKLYENIFRQRDLAHYLHKTLSWFILAIYSGRRYQDIEDFYNWKIYSDHIKLVQQKRVGGRDEKKEIVLFLNNKLRWIIGEIQSREYKTLSNAQADKFLKTINGMLGIEKRITFHCARHTFANVNKKLTPDLTVRRDLLGHDSIDSTLIYDHTDPELLKEAMLKWDSL